MPVQEALILFAIVGAVTAALGLIGIFAALRSRGGGVFSRILTVLVSALLACSLVFFIYMSVQSQHLDVEYEYTEKTTEIMLQGDGGEV